jgi:hypothetical protein
MVAAIWSAPDLEVERFPMLTFARFFNNHGLLHTHGQPQWYFVAGGSHTYVRAFLQGFGGEVHTRADIASIERERRHGHPCDAGGQTRIFDKAVIATHADDALRLLADPSDEERAFSGPGDTARTDGSAYGFELDAFQSKCVGVMECHSFQAVGHRFARYIDLPHEPSPKATDEQRLSGDPESVRPSTKRRSSPR